MMLAETYESLVRAREGLKTLSVNKERMNLNLIPVRENPTEAMTAILRGEGWVHSTLGVGHDFVKVMARKAITTGKGLLEVCNQDTEFLAIYERLPLLNQEILQGKLEHYVGSARQRAQMNISYARSFL